ncbi:MAG: PIN domain nuclease [Nitrospirota bacterium]|nr:PIN domain nuclease [Nitrospirota bacterium]
MIIVDTSVWIDYFNGKISKETDSLDTMLGNQEILLGDLILTEILQGFQEDRLFREAQNMLEGFPVVPMLGVPLAIKSAKNYRTLRKQGVIVRKTIDVMIGTYCIEHRISLLYADRDFDPIVRHLGLQYVL